MNFYLSQIFAFIALVLVVIGMQQNTNRKIILWRIVSAISTLIGFLFFGSVAGIIICTVGILRGLLALYLTYKPNKKTKIIGSIILVLLLILLNIVFWVDYKNIFSLLVGILLIYAFMQEKSKNIRLWVAIATAINVVFTIIILNPMQIAIEVFALTSTLIAIFRYDIVKPKHNQ